MTNSNLIDGAGDEAGHILGVAEDEGKRRRERRRRLRGREADLADAITVAEAEDALHLVERHALLDADHVLVERRALPAAEQHKHAYRKYQEKVLISFLQRFGDAVSRAT